MKKHLLGIAALLVSVVALGLAAIPPLILAEPPPSTESDSASPAPPEDAPSAGLTFRVKSFSIRFGKDNSEAETGPESAKTAAPAVVETAASLSADPQKWFRVAAMGCALGGLLLGPLAWVREREPILSGSAMAICCAALTWQYLVMGIVVGVALIVVLLLLSAISP